MLKLQKHPTINEEALNFSEIENDLKDNLVRIPFSKKYLQLLSQKPKSLDNFDLIVKAQERHDLYNYDGCYDYLLGIWFFENGQWDCEYTPVDLSEDEKRFINGIVWKYRDKPRVANLQVKKAILENFKTEYSLYYENLIGGRYVSEWVSLDGISLLVAVIEDINDGLCEINIQEFLNEE